MTAINFATEEITDAKEEFVSYLSDEEGILMLYTVLTPPLPDRFVYNTVSLYIGNFLNTFVNSS